MGELKKFQEEIEEAIKEIDDKGGLDLVQI